MSVNFGYGNYGMGMNTMGMNPMSQSQGGGINQSIASQYNCPACYQNGPIPYSYKSNVNPLPTYAIKQSWLGKIFGRMFG